MAWVRHFRVLTRCLLSSSATSRLTAEGSRDRAAASAKIATALLSISYNSRPGPALSLPGSLPDPRTIRSIQAPTSLRDRAFEPSRACGKKAIHRLDADPNLADWSSPSGFGGTCGLPLRNAFDALIRFKLNSFDLPMQWRWWWDCCPKGT